MSYAYEMERPLASQAMASERASFIRRTYLHLAGAILAIVVMEAAIFMFLPQQFMNSITGIFFSRGGSLLMVAAFIGVGMLARWWAYNGTSQTMAYAGLSLYVLFWTFLLVPILNIAIHYAGVRILGTAGILTLGIFGGLTLVAFTTRSDFSFLGPILMVGSFLMLGLIIAGIIFGFNLGLWFSFLAVAITAGFILFDTSNIIHHFRTDMHVAAALELFASVALLFWYILNILLSFSGRGND